MSLPSEDLQRLAEGVGVAVGEYTSSESQESRHTALHLAQQLVEGLTTPEDQILRKALNAGEIGATLAFRSLEAFDAIPIDGSSISYAELASKIGADASLLARLSWILISRGILKQIGDDRLAHTQKSLLYINSNPIGGVFQGMQGIMGPFLSLGGYFAKYGRKEPSGLTHNPFTFANGDTDESVWEISHKNPESLKQNMQFMMFAERLLSNAGLYDFDWLKNVAAVTPERTLLVDVGGGQGQAILGIAKERPDLPLSGFVLQDRPEVIGEMKRRDSEELRGVTYQAVDFHTEQPVKGAAIYWIRRCLHDYSDEKCVGILEHLASAMATDSRVLIVEQVLANPPSDFGIMMDLGMLVIGGKERTRANWEELTAKAGLRIANVFGRTGQHVAVIECVRA